MGKKKSYSSYKNKKAERVGANIGKKVGNIAGKALGGGVGTVVGAATANPALGVSVGTVAAGLGGEVGKAVGAYGGKRVVRKGLRVGLKGRDVAMDLKRKVMKKKDKYKYKTKVLKAAGSLVKDLMNPTYAATVYRGYKDGKGIVVPGHKYIGPGNPLPEKLGAEKDKPVNKADYSAYLHDNEYDRYKSAGIKDKDVYLGFSDADKRLMDRSDLTDKSGLITYLGMGFKKGLWKAGVGKRIRDKELTNLDPHYSADWDRSRFEGAYNYVKRGGTGRELDVKE